MSEAAFRVSHARSCLAAEARFTAKASAVRGYLPLGGLILFVRHNAVSRTILPRRCGAFPAAVKRKQHGQHRGTVRQLITPRSAGRNRTIVIRRELARLRTRVWAACRCRYDCAVAVAEASC